MKKQLKLLSLAAALCGAVACSSSTNGTTGGSGTGSGPTGTGTAAGGSGTGSASGGSSSGGSSTGTPPPSVYPCVDGGAPYKPTNPPGGLPFCWCNPGDAGALSYYQIINSCPPAGSTPDLAIPLPPPVGAESIAGLAAANLPLFVDAGIPGQ